MSAQLEGGTTMTGIEGASPGNDMPEPSIDPPEPPRPDELDTWSPGLTDESGELPVSDAALAADGDPGPADVETGEPTG
jgi:hypothetical protein